METRPQLLDHLFWKASDPRRVRLIRVSSAFPPELNPLASDGVVLKAAGVPGEAQHSKWIVAREGILDGIRKGRIEPGTTVIEATSGNTGDGMAKACNALGLRFIAVMSVDVPHDKIDAIRVVGRRTGLHLLSDTDETTVAYARRLGAQDGWYNPDQYSGYWNPQAHCTYLAPQLWEQQPNISLLFVPSGTMGTSIGLSMYVREKHLRTKIIPIVCAEGEEVPGARTCASISKEIRQPVQGFFRETDFGFGMRHESFHLSFLTWGHVIPHLGPTFGLGYAGALRFLQKQRKLGDLDQFRHSDGKIHAVIIGPDDSRPYLPLYFGELKKWELSAKTPPADLLSVLEK